MRHLNNILIEGIVGFTPKEIETTEGTATAFFITNKTERPDEKASCISMLILAKGELASKIKKNIRKDMVVRVLGHIIFANTEYGCGLHIMAEHVEFRKDEIKKSL